MQRLQTKSQRSAYLQALGIDSWVPRTAVDVANESMAMRLLDDMAFDEKDNPAAAKVESARTTDDSPPATGKILVNRGLAMAEVMDIDPCPQPAAGEVASTSVSEIEETDSTGGSAVRGLNFELQCSLLDDLLLIDDVTGVKLVGSAYAHWLRGLALALGRESNKTVDSFTWPLPAGDLFDTGESAVAETLQAWVQRKLELHPVRWVVLMGEAPVSYLASGNNPAVQLGSIARYDGGEEVNALLTWGTAQLWQQPIRKREMWDHFQPLLV